MPRVLQMRAAFLRAVRDDPDNDAPRHAFARWLSGHRSRADRARAEFIEIQLRSAQRRTGIAERLRLNVRERQLSREFEDQWLQDVPAHFRACTFKRGFIEELATDAVSFVDGAKEFFSREVVQEVTFWNTAPRVAARLADCPSLAEVRRACFDKLGEAPEGLLGPPGVSALAASPHLERLERLEIDGAQAGDAAFKTLVRSPHLGRLTSLSAAGNRISADGVAAVTAASLPRRANSLCLGDDHLGPEAARRLLEVPWPRLQELGMTHSGLDVRGLTSLVDADALPRLRKLWANGHPIGVSGAHKIARAAGLGRLQELALADCSLGAAGARALLHWGRVERIEWLTLAGNDLGPDGAQALASSTRLTALRGINLADNDLGPQGATALARATFLPRLRVLDLDGNGIATPGLRHLLSALRGSRLEDLYLSGNGLDDEAAGLLLRWPRLRLLGQLTIDEGNDISNKLQARLHARAQVVEA
ncbi:MAG: TIGR02996 domain-containing protein [Myxococcales bacterium]